MSIDHIGGYRTPAQVEEIETSELKHKIMDSIDLRPDYYLDPYLMEEDLARMRKALRDYEF